MHHLKNILRYSFLLIFLGSLSACEYFNFNKKNPETKGKILARVGNEYLYESDLQGIFNEQTTDSAWVEKQHIDQWIYNELMVQKANNVLPKNSIKDIDRKVSQYRSSLITYLFEKELLNQKIDVNILQNDIDQYYKDKSENLPLSHTIIQSCYIFLDKNAPKMDSIKYWLKNPNEVHLTKLKETGYQFATNLNTEKEWLPLEQLQAKLPEKISSPKSFLKKKKYFEMEDDSQVYLVYIQDYAFEGDNPPQAYAEQDIKRILVNKRKQEYLKRIKNNLFDEAQNANRVETY